MNGKKNFPDELDTVYKGNSTWVLKYIFRWYPHRKGFNTVVVPAGFETDMTSIPQIFYSILPKWGPYAPAAVIHDYLYVTQTTTRKYADQAMRLAMVQLGVSWWKRALIYSALRMAAWYHWNKRSKDLPKKPEPNGDWIDFDVC